MSVRVPDRNESRIEAVVYPDEIHDMVVNLMQRNFGVKDIKHFARSRYLHGKDKAEDFIKYRNLMYEMKAEINSISLSIGRDVNKAYVLFPTSMHEYEIRRDLQNSAISKCAALKTSLQRVVEIFCVDVNIFGKLIKAIDREIDLIKRWRQSDNKMKSYLSKTG